MTNFFISLYHYFGRHKIFFYLSLVSCVLLMAYFSAQVKFEENITSFFPDTEDAANAVAVFDNLKIKDKIIVMVSPAQPNKELDKQQLISAGESLKASLDEKVGGRLIKDILLRVDNQLIGGVSSFIYDNLPVFLAEADYQRFDSLLTEEGIAAAMQRNYYNLLSPAGLAMKNFIVRDPLGLGGNAMKQLQDFQLTADYEMNDGYVFTGNDSTLLMFLTPVFNTGSTGKNDELIDVIESEIHSLMQSSPTVRIEYFGGPSVAVYNARQIKQDTIVTGTIALFIIIVFIFLVFKRKQSVPLIVTPVIFGFLFSLTFIYLLKGSISAIAVGAGSVVFGIALSYSIHMLAHQNHVSSVEQLIRELTYPLTVGSFTTIGAFLGLIFTSSDLLRDFGLFASFALIGTTLFCLVYLPHFLKGQADVKQGVMLRFIEKINSYAFEKNKWLVGGIVVLTVVCLFTSQKVGFNNDMMSINYEPAHLKQAEQKLTNLFDSNEKTVLFVSVGKGIDEATASYSTTNKTLSELQGQGLIKEFASAKQFFISKDEQQQRIERWNDYWTPTKKEFLKNHIQAAATSYRFKEGTFATFFDWVDRPYELTCFWNEENNFASKMLSEWYTEADSMVMLITQVRLHEAEKDTVYQAFQGNNEVVIFDRAYFTNKWVSAVNDDFYLILYISSFLIFFALLLSFGRIELTLMSFLPMFVSWIIILGLMGIFGIEFNIINIILSTFIFGIGDDFSIFIMDGLMNKYRTGKMVLNSHKTAIFFSAFTVIVGIGALIFAKHPALQSLSLISILGIISVVLVAFTIQPIIFKFFIAKPASKGLPPYTLFGLLRTGLLFFLFLFGCVVLRIIIAILYLVPIAKRKKKQFVCLLIQYTCKGILKVATFVRKEKVNSTGEDFKRPAMLIANHQSFLDILVLLSFSPKIVMMTNHWVWNSPLFGVIIRYVDFYYAGDGYEHHVERMRKKVEEGYSIAIFPEGTRTYNGKMKRFHKGAFYLAEVLKLDLIPVILYGNNKVVAKAQPFNIRKGIIFAEILPRITCTDTTYGVSYQERTKRISAYMKGEYIRICKEKNNTSNPCFYEDLVQNYIYKGPVEEWYIRIKVKMENNYQLFNQLVPMEGKITDIGCGYGTLCYMLSMLSEERQITGLDYDEDKIAVAQHGWLRSERLHFLEADAVNSDIEASDVFILNDVLHYMDYKDQQNLIGRCITGLLPDGMIIIRDGNSADEEKHGLTRLTELFSTRILKFNKATRDLCFVSDEDMQRIANMHGMRLESIKNDKYTSNTIYLLKKPD